MKPSALLFLATVAAVTLACTAKTGGNDPKSCPAGEPTPASSCFVEGLACHYEAACGASVACSGGTWKQTTDGCPSDGGSTCPTSVPRAGEPCGDPSVRCSYACGDGGSLAVTCVSGSYRVTAMGCALPG